MEQNRVTVSDTGRKDDAGRPVFEYDADRSAPKENANTTAPQPTYREGGVVHRVEIKSGTGEFTETTLRATRGSAMDNAPADPLDRVVSVYGARVSRADIADGDYVDFLGDHTPARALVAAGLVGKGAQGYQWTSDGLAYLKQAGLVFNDGAPATNTQQPAASNTNVANTNTNTADPSIAEAQKMFDRVDTKLSDESEQFLTASAARVSEIHAHAVVAAVLDQKDGALENMAGDLAAQMSEGVTADSVVTEIRRVEADVIQGVGRLAAEYDVADVNTDPAFVAWVNDPARATTKREALEAFYYGNPAKAKALLAQYGQSDARWNDVDIESEQVAVIDGVQMSARVYKQDGRWMVNAGGQIFALADAKVTQIKK